MPATAPALVQELVDAANAVHDAAKAMKNCKDDARKISKLALEIANSVKNTAVVRRDSSDATDLAITVVAALGATRDVFLQCADFMQEVAGKGLLSRNFRKGLTVDTVGGYLAAVDGLRVLLKIRDQACGVMLEPFAGLGIDSASSKDILDGNITIMDAAYDGLKSTLEVMVNITDGLPWPLKAAPQTFIYILRLLEDCQDVRPKISSLLYSVQNLWTTVGRASRKLQLDAGGDLLRHLSGFFEALQRIAIRLHVVLQVGQTKRALAIHTVRACLDLEQRRLDEARQEISLTLQTETLARVSQIKERFEQQATGASALLTSNMIVSATLPPKPVVFHGRDNFVNDAIVLLTSSANARLAVLGSGGMGKTTVGLALLYDPRIVEFFQDRRLFLSCEALVDADSVVVSLAKLLGLPASDDLLTTVITHLTNVPRVLLVLDNLETIWLVRGGPVSDVEDLLGRLAQVRSLSLVITCRGIVLPHSVEWSNADTATLEPFSIEAALETFEDRSGRKLSGADEEMAKELLNAVDRMPLAVSLLGQLARRGTPIAELLNRWNREHSSLLLTHATGRINNLEVSIGLSIAMLNAGDESRESLQLLSVCCMLPDGLRPEILEKLRPQFKYIERARERLSAYALANLGSDRVLRTLSPVRHLVQERYPAQASHRDALHLIYFDIAGQLPIDMDLAYKELAAAAAPEMGNLSSLLLSLVGQPWLQIVDAVVRFTNFASLRQPTVTVASTLRPHLEPSSEWAAACLQAIGQTQIRLGNYRIAIEQLNAAAQLHLTHNNRSSAAVCKRTAGAAHRVLSEYDHSESLLNLARQAHIGMGDEFQEAMCRLELGELMRTKNQYTVALDHLTAARRTFNSLGKPFYAAYCSTSIGVTHLNQNNLDPAAAELDSARLVAIDVGDLNQAARCTRIIGKIRCLQRDFELAESLLKEAETICTKTGYRLGLAGCAETYGLLRHSQQRYDEAIIYYQSSYNLYGSLHMPQKVQICRKWIDLLESIVRSQAVTSDL